MMVSEDARYPKRVFLRADQEFTDKVEQIRSAHTLKSASSAIRYAVDYTAMADIENGKQVQQNDGLEDGEKEQEKGSLEDERQTQEKTNLADEKRKNKMDSTKGRNVSPDSRDAETVRRVSVEIETLARDGRQRGYLSEEQIDILLAYHRELIRSVRKLAGLDG